MPKKHGSGGLSASATAELFEYLDRFEAKLDHALSQIDRVKREQRSIAETELSLELQQMADFSSLVAEVSKIRGTVASTKAFVQGLKTKIEELGAGMNDAEDQAAVVALAAELAGAETELAEAIAANPTGSTGGV